MRPSRLVGQGKEPFRVKNHTWLLVTGNARWVVPAGAEERRFAVFDVGTGRMQDHEYFAAIERELEDGGYGALLHYLLHWDLSRANLRRIPRTAALFEQKIASLGSEERWLLDILTSGRLPGDDDGEGRSPMPALYADYIRQSQRVGERRRAIETQLGHFLRRFIPGIVKREGRYAESAETPSRRCTVYEFPHLAHCRESFSRATQSDGSWEEPFDWIETDPDRI